MKVKIKKITEKKGDIYILIRCSEPHQEPIPWSNEYNDQDRINEQFQKDSEQHTRKLNEYKKQVQQLHLGKAILTQDEQ